MKAISSNAQYDRPQDGWLNPNTPAGGPAHAVQAVLQAMPQQQQQANLQQLAQSLGAVQT